MGRKSVVSQFNMFAANASMAASSTSTVVNVESCDKASIHLTWTAGPVGEFTIQSRNGAKSAGQTAAYDDSWFEVNVGSLMTITGADSEILIQLDSTPGTDIRLTYTRTSGTASDLKALISMKVLGA